MKRRKKPNQCGFTLVEVLVSMFILTTALLGMSSMVISEMRAIAQSRETSAANVLLQDKMEGLKNITLSALTAGNDSSSIGNITYLRQWAISTVGNLKTITVTVNWTSRGTSHNVSGATLRGQ